MMPRQFRKPSCNEFDQRVSAMQTGSLGRRWDLASAARSRQSAPEVCAVAEEGAILAQTGSADRGQCGRDSSGGARRTAGALVALLILAVLRSVAAAETRRALIV